MNDDIKHDIAHDEHLASRTHCPNCNGTRKKTMMPGRVRVECPYCNGSGEEIKTEGNQGEN